MPAKFVRIAFIGVLLILALTLFVSPYFLLGLVPFLCVMIGYAIGREWL